MLKQLTIGLKIVIGIAIFAWFGLNLAHKIDLTTADLGRHIENGNIIVNASSEERWAVLHTNFYSYTLPDQPFINHHWLSGVVLYFIHQFFGFVGLSVWYVLFGLLTLWLFFDVARKSSNFWIASAVTIIVTPLATSRAEVRPEMFTYFFTGVFFWVLWHFRRNYELGIRNYGLWLLPVLMLLWVNLHIGFVFGFLIIGVFGLEQLIKDLRFKIKAKHSPFVSKNFLNLLYVGIACVFAGLANPNFLHGFLYPLSIFKNYGYLIVENQSIKFLESLGFTLNQHFLLFKIIVAVIVICILFSVVRFFRKLDIAMLILIGVTSVMAYLGIRHFASFGFFALPALSYYAFQLYPQNIHIAYKMAIAFIVMVIVIFCFQQQYTTYQVYNPSFGFGLFPGAEASAQFFIANKIKGPIFNNYDIGGYLIYELNYPHPDPLPKGEGVKMKVYVDNRPEAYTVDFLQNIYITAQNDPEKWLALDQKYDFNVIFFSYLDYTPWAQVFLNRIVHNSSWAPVYVDGYNIILLKKNEQNKDLIQKYQLPQSMFSQKSL